MNAKEAKRITESVTLPEKLKDDTHRLIESGAKSGLYKIEINTVYLSDKDRALLIGYLSNLGYLVSFTPRTRKEDETIGVSWLYA